ncbi:unnamed protein product [Gadus morhua 'NCC']
MEAVGIRFGLTAECVRPKRRAGASAAPDRLMDRLTASGGSPAPDRLTALRGLSGPWQTDGPQGPQRPLAD